MNNSQRKKSVTWDFLELCYQWRKFIIMTTTVITILGILLAFVLPKEYEGVATVLPSQQSGLLGLLGVGAGSGTVSSLAKQFAPLVSGSVQMGAGFNYLAILNSRDAMERVVRKFDLMTAYSISDSSMEKTIKQLRENVDFELDEYGEVVVKVLDRSPIRAAGMANYFVDILNEINGNLSSEDARNVRVFLEKRYAQNISDLEGAEDSLKVFQQNYGAFSLPDQAKATVLTGAELESQIIMNQVKVAALEKQLSISSPEIQSLNNQIQALRQKMSDLNTGKNLKSSGDFGVLVPFKDVPGKTTQYLDLYRNVEIQSKLLELIYPMYEQAKLQEAKETPTVLVLDRAMPPEKKTRPLRALIILSSLVVGFMLSVLFIIFVTNGARMQGDTGPLGERYHELASRIIGRLNRGFLIRNSRGI